VAIVNVGDEMGEAKRRGTFEQRKLEAEVKQELDKEKRRVVIYAARKNGKTNSKTLALAALLASF
jgi:hypothetical protein